MKKACKGREGEGVIEDRMVEWHDRPFGHQFEEALGDAEEPGSLEWYAVHRMLKS